MNLGMSSFLQLDLPAALSALFATLAATLVGNFLVLRKQSLIGDSISHSILPGLVLGFVIAGSRQSLPMILGAGAAALAAVVLIELVRRAGRVESGAAMGVVFPVFFAAGIVFLEMGGAHAVDLDADCVLYGQLETILWLAAEKPSDLLRVEVWAAMPREVTTLASVLAVTALVLWLFRKELVAASFDRDHAASLGLPVTAIDLGLMTLVALVSVAAFEAVGSILIVAMLIVPAAAARVLTNRLGAQIRLSLVFAFASALGGYVLGAFGPFWIGFGHSVSASGMIASLAGVILAGAVLWRQVAGRGLAPHGSVSSGLHAEAI